MYSASSRAAYEKVQLKISTCIAHYQKQKKPKKPTVPMLIGWFNVPAPKMGQPYIND